MEENITITVNTVLQFFGAVAIIGGGVKVIIGMLSPFKQLQEEVDRVKGFLANDKKRLEDGDEKMSEITKRLDHQDAALSAIGLAICELINHTLTGNDVEKLKELQHELNEFFYNGKEKK